MAAPTGICEVVNTTITTPVIGACNTDLVFRTETQSQKLLLATGENVIPGITISSNSVGILNPNPASNFALDITGHMRIASNILMGPPSTTTGIFLPSSNTINITTDNTTQLTITNSNVTVTGDFNFNGTLLKSGVPYIGSQWSNNSTNVFLLNSNVGIQTQTPQAPLDINGSIRIASNIYSSTAGTSNIPSYSWTTNSNTGMFLASNNTLAFTTNGIPRLVITNSNVTATGDFNFNGTLLKSGVPYIGSQWSNNSTNVFLLNSNVGIRTQTPQAPLDVNGSIRVASNYYTATAGTSTVPSYSWGNNSNTGMFNSSNNTIAFTAGGTTRMTISNNIGVTGHIIPSANEIYDLGASNQRFRDLYLSGNTIILGSNYTIKGDPSNGGIMFTNSNGTQPAKMIAREIIIGDTGTNQKVIKMDPTTKAIKFFDRDTTSGFENEDKAISGAASSITTEPNLYDFTTFSFDKTNAEGTGPTLQECITFYSSRVSWVLSASYFNMTTQGIQEWTVPITGSYSIVAAGAKGGNGQYADTYYRTGIGGNGRIISCNITLKKNDKLFIILGQIGLNYNPNSFNGLYFAGGGGGGTFVFLNSRAKASFVLAAGGGGGGGSPAYSQTDSNASYPNNMYYGYSGSDGNTEPNGLNADDGGNGGINGSPGFGIAGGFDGNNGSGGSETQGGGSGGGGIGDQNATYSQTYGGFGGGGGGYSGYSEFSPFQVITTFGGGGGGGGYSGGGGGGIGSRYEENYYNFNSGQMEPSGMYSYTGGGGGGGGGSAAGSLSVISNYNNNVGLNNGPGYVTITLLYANQTNRSLMGVDDSSNAPSYSWSGNSNTGMYHPVQNAIGFSTNGIPRMVITSNVGIGIQTPLWPLHVAASNITDDVSIYAEKDIVAFSDSRFKYDIIPIANALSNIDLISGYTFKWNSNSERRSAGVLAQEVQRILPEVVHEDPNGRLSVSYGNMIALLIEAIKEIKTELKDLKKNS
jgi:hypothetical protein